MCAWIAAAFAAVIFAVPAHAQLNCYPWEMTLPQCQGRTEAPAYRPTPAPPRAVHTTPRQERYELPENLRRQELERTVNGLAVGDIFINRERKYLYLVVDTDKVIRYGIGVGREGFGELTVGEYTVGDKKEWPWWYPPVEMQARDPKAARYPRGMPGGENNPLGARALYLHKEGGKDSLFRIHGTNEPWTIGEAVSSGCFRMLNADVIHLYERVGKGARVIVR